MGLLGDAAHVWAYMEDIQYQFLLGRKRLRTEAFTLAFLPDAFSHCAGIQYANDVDFGIPRAALRGSKLLSKLLSQVIDDKKIEKSENWEKIRGRLEGILRMESVLDDCSCMFLFLPQFSIVPTAIEARYIIRDNESGATYFFFLDEDNQTAFCRSIFRDDTIDYTISQSRLPVLKRDKYKGDRLIASYTHPRYVPPEKSE